MEGPALDDRGLPAGYPFRPDMEVSPRQTRELLAARAVRLIDCRTRAEWERARIEGAELVPIDDLPRHVEDLMDEERPIVIVCHHGSRSLRATLLLRAAGIEGVRSMAGGIEAWSLGVDPSVPRY